MLVSPWGEKKTARESDRFAIAAQPHGCGEE
jgi:hypothetical protein